MNQNRRAFLRASAGALAIAAMPIAAAAVPMPIKVYQLNEFEWWAAATLADAITDWKKWTGLTDDELDAPRELTAEEMRDLVYVEVDDNMRRSSFAEELQARVDAGLEFPQPFATTEY
jgi:hypothetical protein